jgi:DeoR family transcriptional regulator of aga operon
MKRYERLNAILELLALDAKLDVDTGAPRLGVSEATIRRDLECVAEQRLLTRTHGGALTVVVVADATKLGKRAFARIRPIDGVDVLVTDSAADPELLERFTAAGVRVVTA